MLSHLCLTLFNAMVYSLPSSSAHGILLLPPGDLPDPGMEPVSVMSPALSGKIFTTSAT